MGFLSLNMRNTLFVNQWKQGGLVVSALDFYPEL